MSVAPITNAYSRRSVMDFVDVQFYPEYYSPMYKKPPSESKVSGLFLRPFKNDVWHYLMLVSVVEAILFGLVFGIIKKRRNQEQDIWDSVGFTIGSLCQRGEANIEY